MVGIVVRVFILGVIKWIFVSLVIVVFELVGMIVNWLFFISKFFIKYY